MSCPWVLVVDDDSDLRETVTAVLESEGYKTAQASNGKDALELLERRPEPCLILLDIIMPVMSGAEFCEKLGEQHRLSTLPVVIVAGIHGFEPDGVRGVIRKPVSADLLLRVVREYCGAPPADREALARLDEQRLLDDEGSSVLRGRPVEGRSRCP